MEDHADGFPPVESEFGPLHLGQLFFADGDGAGGGGIQPADEVQEGGFSGPGSAHDGDKLAFQDVERDALQSPDFDRAFAVCFAEIDGLKDGVQDVAFLDKIHISYDESNGKVSGVLIERDDHFFFLRENMRKKCLTS